MLKQTELRNPNSCLNKASFDEPVFVLRAKDRLAPQTLRLWAAMAVGAHEPEKISEAMNLADQMEKFRASNFPEPTVGAPAVNFATYPENSGAQRVY